MTTSHRAPPPETEPSTAGQVGLLRLAQRQTAGSAAGGLNVTFSAGITAYHVDESIDQTLIRADKALYAAKAAGHTRSLIAE